jgi:hypothetical protein
MVVDMKKAKKLAGKTDSGQFIAFLNMVYSELEI